MQIQKHQEVNSNNTKPMQGGLELAGAAGCAYLGANHGLHRILGIRIENHHTLVQNAKKIIEEDYFLDPSKGGKNGFGQVINSTNYIEKSRNYIHISGLHKDSKDLDPMIDELPKIFQGFSKKSKLIKTKILPSVYRKIQSFAYRFVANSGKYIDFKKSSFSEKVRTIVKALFSRNVKTFYIPGTDNYFNKNFIPDCDDVALKSTKRLKVYRNKLSATLAGFRRFGLTGLRGNKARGIAGGIIIVGLGSVSYLMALKGFVDCRKSFIHKG